MSLKEQIAIAHNLTALLQRIHIQMIFAFLLTQLRASNDWNVCGKKGVSHVSGLCFIVVGS